MCVVSVQIEDILDYINVDKNLDTVTVSDVSTSQVHTRKK